MSEKAPDPPATQSHRHSAIDGRPFRLLLAGSSVSLLGTRISTIAFPMLVLWITHSPVAAGWTAFAATAPSVLVYVPAGALVDVWPPRRVMLISEFGRGVALFAVVIALLFGKAFLPLLIGAAIVEEILEVFSTLAERRYVGSLVRHDQASSAVVQMEARTHVMVLAGRPLGGILFAAQPLLPFIVDMLSFVVSVSALVAIKSEPVIKLITLFPRRICPPLHAGQPAGQQCDKKTTRVRSRPPLEDLWKDIRRGLSWLRSDLFACVSIVLSAGTTLICQALIMIFLAYASDQHLPSFMIGIALAASGLGGAIGSVLASRLPAPTSYQWTLTRITAWIISVAVLVAPSGLRLIAPGEFLFARFALVMSFLGFTGALGNVEFGTYLIQKAPEDMLARITSIGRLISFGACAVGPVLGGLVIQRYKILGAVPMLSVAIIALTAVSLLLPSTQTRKCRISKMAILALRIVLFSCITLTIQIIGGLLKSEPQSINCSLDQQYAAELDTGDSTVVQLAQGHDDETRDHVSLPSAEAAAEVNLDANGDLVCAGPDWSDANGLTGGGENASTPVHLPRRKRRAQTSSRADHGFADPVSDATGTAVAPGTGVPSIRFAGAVRPVTDNGTSLQDVFIKVGLAAGAVTFDIAGQEAPLAPSTDHLNDILPPEDQAVDGTSAAALMPALELACFRTTQEMQPVS